MPLSTQLNLPPIRKRRSNFWETFTASLMAELDRRRRRKDVLDLFQREQQARLEAAQQQADLGAFGQPLTDETVRRFRQEPGIVEEPAPGFGPMPEDVARRHREQTIEGLQGMTVGDLRSRMRWGAAKEQSRAYQLELKNQMNRVLADLKRTPSERDVFLETGKTGRVEITQAGAQKRKETLTPRLTTPPKPPSPLAILDRELRINKEINGLKTQQAALEQDARNIVVFAKDPKITDTDRTFVASEQHRLTQAWQALQDQIETLEAQKRRLRVPEYEGPPAP